MPSRLQLRQAFGLTYKESLLYQLLLENEIVLYDTIIQVVWENRPPAWPRHSIRELVKLVEAKLQIKIKNHRNSGYGLTREGLAREKARIEAAGLLQSNS